MVAPPNAAQFMSALLTAVHELTGKRPPPTWTHVEKLHVFDGVEAFTRAQGQ